MIHAERRGVLQTDGMPTTGNTNEGFAGDPTPDRRDTRGWLAAAVLFTIACNVANTFFLPGFSDFEHEGILLKPAADWLGGRMLYRDVFSQYGPVSIVCQALAMKLFGPFVFVVKAQLVVVYALTSWFLFLVWRRLFSAALACGSVILWNLLSYHFVNPAHPWSSSFALLFQSISLYCLLEALARQSPRHLVLAGVAGGLTVFSKQNVGGYLLIAEAVGLAWFFLGRGAGLRTIAGAVSLVAGGAIAVAATVFAWLASNDALWPWFQQNVIWPPAFAKIMGSSDPSMILERLFLIDATFATWYGATAGPIFVLMPLVTIAVAVWGVVARARSITQRPSDLLVVFALCGLASWLQYYPVNGLAQVWWGASPLVGLFVGCLHGAVTVMGSRMRLSRLVIAGVTVAVIEFLCSHEIYWRGVAFAKARNGRLVRVKGDGPISGMLVSPQLDQFIRAIEDVIDREIVAKQKTDVLLFGINGFYLFMIKGHVPFHPHWYLGDLGVVAVLYPDIPDLVDEHIRTKRPHVIVDSKRLMQAFHEEYPDYRLVDAFEEPARGWVFALFEPPEKEADEPDESVTERPPAAE